MGKHTQEPMTSRNAVTGEAHDLAYWHRMLLAAQADDRVLHVEMAYWQIDRLLDQKLATR